MATAEQLVQSIQFDGRGVHLLLWDDKGDLVRTFIVLIAAMREFPQQYLSLSSENESVPVLRALFDVPPPLEDAPLPDADSLAPRRKALLVLFLQQATSRSIGPWLNGWRTALAEPPGTLLVVRRADFTDFQRAAPDLISFVGPKTYDSGTMLSIWSEETAKKVNSTLPKDVGRILRELPGERPSGREIAEWIKEHPPVRHE